MSLSSRHFHSSLLAPIVVSSWLFFSLSLFANRTSHMATEINSPPVAVNDSYTVHGQRALTPMDNDYDPDGDPISLYWATQPQHGTATVVSSTQLSYVATAGYVGSDSFTYTIRDSSNTFATATITITDVNQSPVAVTDSYTVHGQASFYPAANDYDPDNDGVSFKVLATNPQHGTVNVNPDGLCGYMATYGYTGPDSFTYKIQDGLGAVTTGTVNINVVNQPPIAIPDVFFWKWGDPLSRLKTTSIPKMMESLFKPSRRTLNSAHSTCLLLRTPSGTYPARISRGSIFSCTAYVMAGARSGVPEFLSYLLLVIAST